MSTPELAWFEEGALFLLVPLAPDAAPAEVIVELAGTRHDAGAHHIRADALLLVALPVAARPKPGAVARLHLDDRARDIRLGRDRAAFATMLGTHGATLRRLLMRMPRVDAFAIEAAAWPEAAAREEQSELTRLDRNLFFALDLCCVPVPGVMVALFWLDDPDGVVTAIDVFHGDGDTPFERALIPFERADPPPDQTRLRLSPAFAIVLRFDETVVTDDDFVLLVATRDALWPRTLRPRGRLERGLRVLETQLRRLDANAQLAVLEPIAALVAGRPELAGEQVILRAMQEFAIGTLPEDITRPDLGLRIGLDLACTVTDVGVFLQGWALRDEKPPPRILFRGSNGTRHEISRDWVMNARLDVMRRLQAQAVHARTDQLGFICFVPTPADATLTAGYLVAEGEDGRSVRMRTTLYLSAGDPLDAIKPVLTSFAQTHHDLRRLLDRHVGPAVRAVWRGHPGGAEAVDIMTFGAVAERPEVSVVIPIYGRCDFIEFQVANFANDPDLRRHEVLFVIDDPTIYDEAVLLARDVERIFRFPFRLIYGRRNLGFSGATNLGAAQARGSLLLMMNSDVLPLRPGWLSDLAAAARGLPQAGAVSPVLLYDDGSIQHAGMVFARYPLWADMWVNEHPGKGLPKLPMPAPFECVAVTGACLMIDHALWRALGGLSEEFIIGDFEDSDLCMRLRAAGRRNWVVPSVELVHLERQSQDLIGDAAWRTNLTLYNCWTHHRKWDAAITAWHNGMTS